MMVKKLKTQAETEDMQLAEAVRVSAQQIWQAGLGAFAKAQEEGGRVFARLVKEGSNLQRRSQQVAEDKVADITETVTKMADSVSKQAAGSWDKLDQVFEDRVARSLANLGVPTQRDIQHLTQQVNDLSKIVAELSRKKPAKLRSQAKQGSQNAAVNSGSKHAPDQSTTHGTLRKSAATRTAKKAAP